MGRVTERVTEREKEKRMVCNEQCLKLFGMNEKKETSQEFNITGETIRRGEIQIEHAHLNTKLNNKAYCQSNSDVGSESDSGLGSVRTSKKESDSQKTISEPEVNAAEPESTICTVTRADSMGTLAQDCYSLDQFDDEFISILDGSASETLTDLVMQEFSKMKTIDVMQLQSDFAKFERVGLRPTHKPRTTRSSALPQLMVAQAKNSEQKDQPVKAVNEPQVQKREKKMRKKRKMIRQRVEGANESSTSSSESDIVQQKPKRKTQSTEQQQSQQQQAVQAANGDKQ